MEEDVQRPFYHTDHKTLYGGTASGWSNSQIQSDCETYEDYISGNYNAGIIVDKQKYPGGLEEFLEMKRINDYEITEKARKKRYQELKEKHGC